MKPHPETNSAEFLRLLRSSGWSQAQAARALEITPGAVSQICHRKTHPRTSTVRLLRQMLAREQPGLPLSRLNSEPTLDSWERNLVDHLRNLGPAERRAVAFIVRRLAGK